MTEQTLQTTQVQSEQQASNPGLKQPRQLVRFTFYKLDPQWQLLEDKKRQQGKQELLAIFEEYTQGPLMRSFSLYGLRSDCDFMLWQASYAIEDLQRISSKIRRSAMGPYLRETEASRYTLRDTPMFTCVAQTLQEILEAVGA